MQQSNGSSMELYDSPNYLKVLDIGEDNRGFYLKVQVIWNEETCVIRWGLDAYSYIQFQKILADIPKDVKSLTLLPNIVEDASVKYLATVVIELERTQVSKTFPCSQLFASNLVWLRSVTHHRQLEEIKWREDSPKRKNLQRWFKSGKWMGAVSIVVGICAFGFLYTQKAMVASNQATDSGTVESKAFKTDQTNHWDSENDILEAKMVRMRTNAMEKQKESDDSAMETFTYTNQLHLPAIYGVAEGQVALTFDDGPSPYTYDIVSILQKYNVKATFFFVGNQMHKWPDAVQKVVKGGNVVGNHSATHPFLPKLSYESQMEQITRCANDMQALQVEEAPLFRPPYGAFNLITEKVLHTLHMTIALWNRDPRDWAAKSVDEVVNAVVQNHPSGGVFDLHENKLTVAALPKIIEELKGQGLKFVVLHAPNP